MEFLLAFSRVKDRFHGTDACIPVAGYRRVKRYPALGFRSYPLWIVLTAGW